MKPIDQLPSLQDLVDEYGMNIIIPVSDIFSQDALITRLQQLKQQGTTHENINN